MTEMTEMIPEISEQLLRIIEEEIIPFAMEGIGSGFALGTIFALIAYGIYKAMGLLNINHR